MPENNEKNTETATTKLARSVKRCLVAEAQNGGISEAECIRRIIEGRVAPLRDDQVKRQERESLVALFKDFLGRDFTPVLEQVLGPKDRKSWLKNMQYISEQVAKLEEAA